MTIARDPRTLLVTGGCGFIGTNLVRHLLASHADCRVVNLDALTYAGNPANHADLLDEPRYRFVHGDVRDGALVARVMAEESPDAVLHLAAESHVDRSIESGAPFVDTNVLGTQVLLDAARAQGVARFLQVSTDEVYGSLEPGRSATETYPIVPSSPYAASKAGADLLVEAAHRTYGMDVVITRCSNNYGPYQFPEKFLPLMMLRTLRGERLPIYGDGLYTRDWIHVEDHCRAIDRVLRAGTSGAIYNVGADAEQVNLDIARGLLRLAGRADDAIDHVADRPGHDRRYSIDAGRLHRELGWEPRYDFAAGLAATWEWYTANESWWLPILERDPLVERTLTVDEESDRGR